MGKKFLPGTLCLLLLILSSCGTPKLFRSITPEEKTAVNKARKTIPRKDTSFYVLMMTNLGDMVLKLYNETPLHRDNFINKVKSGFYDSLLFHRVINDFMIQGGDPTSKYATAEQGLGGGAAPGGRIPAEIKTDIGIYHKRGALAAARVDNPKKESSNCQFYIVQHPAWRPGQLDSMSVQRNLTLNTKQKEIYTTQGGTPHLDGEYTVFGELISGWEVLDAIAKTKRNRSNRPETDVRMKLFIVHTPKK